MRDDEGYDPLGADFIKTNSAAARRKTGSTYTPPSLVDDMVAAAARAMEPDIVVDCGCGSGRFAIACARAFPSARVIAVDNSREACAMTRENAAANGCASQALVDGCGMALTDGPSFNLVSEGPRPGEVFRRETRVAGTKADVVLGLFDGRIMCLECKVSNSEVNSYKRLNHEVIDKVAKWTGEFGRQCVPGAVLKGCFKASNLVSAQGEGAFLFWSSSLDSLVDFVNETKRR